MKPINNWITLLGIFACSFVYGQEPTEEFLNKLDSLGATDSVAQSEMIYNKGVGFMEGRKYSEAIEQFNLAMTYVPEMASAMFNRGVCYHNLGSKDKALGDLRSALDLDPNLDWLIMKWG